MQDLKKSEFCGIMNAENLAGATFRASLLQANIFLHGTIWMSNKRSCSRTDFCGLFCFFVVRSPVMQLQIGIDRATVYSSALVMLLFVLQRRHIVTAPKASDKTGALPKTGSEGGLGHTAPTG